MKVLRSHILSACAASTVTALVVGGIAWAAVPSRSTGQIAACYKTSGPNKGELRIIDHQAGRSCSSTEAMLLWPTHDLRWRGSWSRKTVYAPRDAVSYQGSSFVALVATEGITPASGHAWSTLAGHGATGRSGPRGRTGATGVQGTTGASGTTGARGPQGPAGATGATGPQGTPQYCSAFPHTGVDWSLPGSTPGNGCNFSGDRLMNVNISDANLTNMNLNGVDFDSDDLAGAILTGANMTGAKIDGAVSNLTAANLSDANLTDADISGGNNFTGANLIGANLTSANLGGDDLTDADLSGATGTGTATLTGVIWSNTTCPDGTISNTNGTSPQSCIGHL